MLAGLRAVALPLTVTLSVQTMVSLLSLAVPVLAPRLGPALGVPATWSGYYVGLLYFGAVVTSATARGMVPRLGALGTSVLAIALASAGLAVIGAGWLALAAAGTAVMGLGYGLTNPAGSEILARRTPRHVRSLVFSLKQTGVPAGGALAGLILPRLVAWGDWQVAIAVIIALAAGLIALLLPLRRRFDDKPAPSASGGQESTTRAASPVRMVLATPTLRNLALASFGFSAMQLSLVSFLVIHVVERVGLDLVSAGALLATAQGAGVAGRVLFGIVADRVLGTRRTLLTLASVMAVCALVAATIGPGWTVPALALLFVLFGGSAIAWNGVFLSEIVYRAPPGEAATVTGGALAFTFSGVVAGPPLFAATVGLAGSYGAAYVLMAALVLVSAWLITRS